MLPSHPHRQIHSIDTDTSVPPTKLFSGKKGHGKVRQKGFFFFFSELRRTVLRSIQHATIIGHGLAEVTVAFIAALLCASELSLEAQE